MLIIRRLRNVFFQSAQFSIKNNVFYQTGLQIPAAFEKLYLSLREKEMRVLSDEIVKALPDIPTHHPLKKEWDMRKYTLKLLMRYLTRASQGKDPSILEVGCGNGWLSSHLAGIENCEVLALDVNETELLQAARVFSDRKNICLAYADILSADLPYRHFDYIVLAASLQYFRRPDVLFEKLLPLLAEAGEIHIIDTPFYSVTELPSVQARSRKYFVNTGFAEMTEFYHHHTLETVKGLDVHVLYNPNNLFNTFRRKFSRVSPFPWLMVKRQGNRS